MLLVSLACAGEHPERRAAGAREPPAYVAEHELLIADQLAGVRRGTGGSVAAQPDVIRLAGDREETACRQVQDRRVVCREAGLAPGEHEVDQRRRYRYVAGDGGALARPCGPGTWRWLAGPARCAEP